METLITFLSDKVVYTILPFICFLGVLIFIHELGHFLVARFCGVRVEVFSMGFGKKIFQYKRGDTNYCLSIFPLGGYVKMYGDQPSAEVPDELKRVSFTHKNVWQRIAIVLAGPLMNLFFALVLYSVIFMVGENVHVAKIGDVTSNSIAEKAGFTSGDQIIAVNDIAVLGWDDLQNELNNNKGQEVTFSVLRKDSVDLYPSVDKADAKVKVLVSTKENPNIISMEDKIGEVSGVNSISRGTFIGVMKSSPLNAFGVKTGDQIIAIGSGKSETLVKVKYWRDLELALSQVPIESPLVIEFTRKNSDTKVTTPETFKVTLAGSALFKNYSTSSIGIESSELYLDKIVADSPAEKSGLKTNDRLVSIDGNIVNTWDDVLSQIKSYSGKGELQIAITREGEQKTFAVTPKISTFVGSYSQDEQRYVIGIGPYINIGPIEVGQWRTSNPLLATYKGVLKTIEYTKLICLGLVRLVQAKISTKNIGGIISVGQVASDTAKLGLMAFLQMMALYSINLFILNLLPIPLLDGGHLVFYILEVIKGKPVSLKKMEIAQQIGIVILLSLMIFGFVNDITRVFMK